MVARLCGAFLERSGDGSACYVRGMAEMGTEYLDRISVRAGRCGLGMYVLTVFVAVVQVYVPLFRQRAESYLAICLLEVVLSSG